MQRVLSGLSRVSMRPSFAAPAARFMSGFMDRDECMDRVLEVVRKFPKVDQDKVTPTAHFVNDLGLDSLDTVELGMAFEEEFSLTISDEDAEKIMTPEDAVTIISEHPMSQ